MIQRTITQAKGQLSSLVKAVFTGEEVVLIRSGRAAVKIVRIEQDTRTREPGGLKKLVFPDIFDVTDESIIQEFELEHLH